MTRRSTEEVGCGAGITSALTGGGQEEQREATQCDFTNEVSHGEVICVT